MRGRSFRGLHVMLGFAVLSCTTSARAHGVWGHVHVTGWAIENLPPGELREFLADPEVREAAQFGAAFTDSGYSIEQRKVIPLLGASDEEIAIGHEYSEHTHWEPFVEAMVRWIRENDPPPWTSVESKKRVAFLMGVGAHGLQDEIFDSVFLYQTMKYDGQDQNAADPGTDYLLNEQGYLRFAPKKYVPMDTVREIYSDLGLEVSEAIVQKGVDTVGDFYLNSTFRAIFTTVIANGDGNPNNIPWTKEHYLDPDVPGSLVAEIVPTAQYMRAIWRRLHGQFGANDAVVATYPATPRRLRSHETDNPDAWVTLIFGQGVAIAGATGSFIDAAGQEAPFAKDGTRWGAEFPRLMRLKPTSPLVPGAWYDAGMLSGATLIGSGEAASSPFSFHFQVACTDDPSACPNLGGPIPVPALDGSGPPPGLWPPEDGGDGDGASGDGNPGDGASEDGSAGGDGGNGDGSPGTDEDAGMTGGQADGGPSKPGAAQAKSAGGCAVGSSEAGLALPWLGFVLLFLRRRKVHPHR